MVLQTETTSLLNDPEPPFLQEPTLLVEPEPLTPALDRLVNIVYRWRLVLAVGLVPLFLAAMAISFNDNTNTDAADAGATARDTGQAAAVDAGPDIAGDEAISAFEAMVRGVVPTDEEANADPSLPALPSPSTTDGSGATTETTVVETTSPPTTVPSTTVPSTTVPPTTLPTTTAPPTTIVQCLVSVRRRTDLRAGPDGDAEKLARVTKGTYGGFGSTDDGKWYQIDFQGTIGWVRERSVDEVQGAC